MGDGNNESLQNKPRGLGRGLDSLFFSSGAPDSIENSENIMSDSEKVYSIDINKIFPNAQQPRKRFEDTSLDELAQSIKEHGVIQPILVKISGSGYEIIAGERRWRAARRAELKEIPCLVKDFENQNNMLIALIENMQREDLNAIEEAVAFQHMANDFNLTQDEIAKSVGKSRPYITNALRLLKLPEDIQNYVIEGKLSSGHARAIAGIERRDAQIAAAEEVIEKGLSVRQVELFSEGKPTKRPTHRQERMKQVEIELSNIESELRSTLGTKVKIIQKDKRGIIEIEYYSKEELERLIELLFSLQ